MSSKQSRYMDAVFAQMLDDLHYPVAKDGSIMDASAVKTWVCWHLVRCGWRKPNNTDGLALAEEYDDPLIKKRKVLSPGVVEDAVAWVPANTPDDPLTNLANMTMAQIEALPADLRGEAKRRLGMGVDAPEAAPGWTQSPHVTISDGPDTADTN